MWDDFEEKLEEKNELLAAMDVKKKEIEKATGLIRAVLDKTSTMLCGSSSSCRKTMQLTSCCG